MSPKNKGRNKAPITDPDEFISGVQSAADRLKPYAGHIVLGAGVLLLVALALAVYSWIIDRRETSATEAFAEILDISGEPVGQRPMPTPQGGMIEPSFETSEERAEEALERLEAFLNDHGSAALAGRARLLEGRLLLDLGRYDEAREALRAVAESDDALDLSRAIAREGVGYAYEGEARAEDDAEARQRGLESALAAFEDMEAADDGPMWAQALYHQGRLLEDLGREDEAIERYREAREAPGRSWLASEIDERLVALDAPPEESGEQGEVPLEPADPADAPSDAEGAPAAPPQEGGAMDPTEP